MKILSGNSNRPLAEAISACLNTPLTKAAIRRFSDLEVFVEILENVRGEDVFIIQSTSYPANDNLMELLVSIDALRRGSAQRITAVIPYYGYARQDRKTGPRTPISAKLVANLVTTAGADRVLTMDLHAGQIQGFFDAMPGGVTTALVLVMIVIFLLGFILDFIEITFVVVPIVGPVLLAMGVDPIWLGVVIAINLQTSFLTPPFGFALFYLRGVAPSSIETKDIYLGALPFVGLQILILILLFIYPSIATWLPARLYG